MHHFCINRASAVRASKHLRDHVRSIRVVISTDSPCQVGHTHAACWRQGAKRAHGRARYRRASVITFNIGASVVRASKHLHDYARSSMTERSPGERGNHYKRGCGASKQAPSRPCRVDQGYYHYQLSMSGGSCIYKYWRR